MKKTLIALAVLGVTSAAFAQSNVTVYGQVDIGFRKDTGVIPAPAGSGIPATTDGWTMAERDPNSRLGIMGTEDLGGGLKATFQLEQRFALMHGQSSVRGDFEGAANVGLAGAFGAVRFGRLNELSTETYRRVDPFNQVGVAAQIYSPLRGNNADGRLSYGARYDAPAMNGIKLGATYSVSNAPGAIITNGGFGTNHDTSGNIIPGAADNAGFGVSATYDNGPLYLVANYNKAVDSGGSYNWNLGGEYSIGPAKLSLGYEKTEMDSLIYVSSAYATQRNWIAAVSYTVGKGVINASYNNSQWSTGDAEMTKWALGYTHNLSKRTSLYANYARSTYDGTYRAASSGVVSTAGAVTTGGSKKTAGNDGSAVEIGITHKF